jgi:Arc/MetJ family transcription regulator
MVAQLSEAAEFEVADAAAVLEWWQRQYEVVDDRMLAEALRALRLLAERDDHGLESAFTCLAVVMAELEASTATLSVVQRMQRASLEKLIRAALVEPAEAAGQSSELRLSVVLRRALIGVARHGTPSGGETSLIPRLIVTSSQVGQVTASAKAIAAAIKERLEADALSCSRVTGLRLLQCTWDACSRRARKQAAVVVSAADAVGSHAEQISLQRVGAALMNAAVDSVLFDSVGKVRRAGLRLLQEAAPHLPPDEVLKLALAKARDKDKETRKMAFRIIGQFVDSSSGTPNSDPASRGGSAAPERAAAAEGPARECAELPQTLLAAEAVDVLVHQAYAPDGTADMRRVAQRVFWSFVIGHVPDPAAALRSLGVMSKLAIYESLLRARADELYGAQFDEDILLGGAGEEDQDQLRGDVAGEVY